MMTSKTMLRAVLLSTAVGVVTPAAADPLKDDLGAIRKVLLSPRSISEPFGAGARSVLPF